MLNELLPLHHTLVWVNKLQSVQSQQLLLDLLTNFGVILFMVSMREKYKILDLNDVDEHEAIEFLIHLHQT